MLIDFDSSHLLICLLALAITLIVLWNQKKSFSYLFFLSAFWLYLIGVVSVVVFPIHIPDDKLYPNISLQMNLVPFDFGACDPPILCVKNIYENILLTIPFGFGISFISKIRPRNIYWLALAVGLMLEITQLVISLIVHSPFRVVDINDVLLNAIGVLIGYGLFRIFGKFYSAATHKFQIRHRHVFAYIYNVVHNPDR
jgi:glycopeptide antibiotics resistance protein